MGLRRSPEFRAGAQANLRCRFRCLPLPLADMPDAVPEVPRCEKIKRSGLRCGRKAVPGSIHCWNHSAIALQAEAATAQADCRGRLIEAADKAVGALIGLLDAEDEGIRLRATTAVLDRLGVSGRPADRRHR